MNLIILKGNLGRDVELKHLPSGKAIAKFSIGVSSGYGDKKKTDWFNIIAWEKLGESAQKYLEKGSQVLVTGRAANVEYDKQDGTHVQSIEVVASNIEFLDKPATKREPSREIPDEDIPF